jgi:hypothetical protein
MRPDPEADPTDPRHPMNMYHEGLGLAERGQS